MISVIIPAYNEEKYIGRCLESLMQQEEKPDEIIVVDNNSTDDTVKIAQKYPVRIVAEKEQGMIPARNRGFNEANYEFIARTDADTIVPPDWIKKIKKNFKDKKIIAVSGPANFYSFPNIVQMYNWHSMVVFDSFKKVLGHDCMFGPNMALRKSAWEKVKKHVCLDDNEVHEDIDLSIHLAPFGQIKFDRDMVVSSSSRRLKKLESFVEYPYRGLKSIVKHRKVVIAKKTQLFQKFFAKYIF